MNAIAFPTRDEMEVMKWEAGVLVASGFLPKHIQKPEHAIAIMLKGRELGVPSWTALTKIQVIQGNPTTAPELMLALIYRSGELEDMQIDSQESACKVTMKRKGKSPLSASFSLDDAKKMGLADKDNWKKQPATMMKWRAISACARLAFPDIIQGMYTHEEIAPDSAVNVDGELIEPPAAPLALPSPEPAPANGNRPYAPDQLQSRWATLSPDKAGAKLPNARQQIDALFAGLTTTPADAETFVLWLTGKQSLSEVSQSEFDFLKKIVANQAAAKVEIERVLAAVTMPATPTETAVQE